MADDAGIDAADSSLRNRRSFRIIRSCFLLLLLSLLFLPGCGGCSSSTPKTAEELAQEAAEKEKQKKEAELKKKKEERKPDFVFGRVTLQPGSRGLPSIYMKPGHWVSAVQSAKTNNFDFLGEMDAAIVDFQGAPIDLDRTPFRISTARPAALVKGQEKFLDMTVFVPHAMRRARLSNSLRGAYAGSFVNREESIFSALPPYQYVLLVVARTPERYGYLNQKRNPIVVPWSIQSRYLDDKILQYLVVTTTSKLKPILLPSDAFTWTSTAYFIWDDVDPDALSPEQQQALVDWLHWGGQLIISGPGSMAQLKDSFLSPYLPAVATGTREVTSDDLAELNSIWTLPFKNKPGYPVRAAKPWSGVELRPHAAAQVIPNTAGLLVERRVGLGRIAVSAIHLSQPELTQWPSFDGFLNACLLRRDARKWERGLDAPRLTWAEGDPRPDDPARVTGVRYFSRDAGSQLDYHMLRPASEIPQQDYSPHRFGFRPNLPAELPEEDIESTQESLAMGGVASWNPFSPISDAARDTLREAAGVKIPKVWFVLKLVGIYILVVVPVNWLVFTLVGRLEWAWIAAPILAIVFSVIVVRQAQLDIGFVRSQTEVAVLELQPNYARGHLTRYLALYTSLGTQYDLHFESPTAVAQPLPLNADFELRVGQSFSTVNYRRFEEVTLNDVTVSSNSMGMVHGEQMLKTKQPLSIHRNADGFWHVTNGSEYDLEVVSISRNLDRLPAYHYVRKMHDGLGTEFAWVGQLKAGETKPVSFHPATLTNNPTEERMRKSPPTGKDSLRLDRLYRIAEASESLAPGETRLVGQINAVLPGARVTPQASQSDGATLVVAHLAYEHLPAPRPDVNTAADIDQPLDDSGFPLDEILSPSQPAVP